MHRRLSQRHLPEYKGNAALIKSKKTDELQIETLDEVAELLNTDVPDLSWMPFGMAGVMYFSRRTQLDDDAPWNSNAIMIAKKMMHAGMNMGVRGDVVIFRESPPWGPLEGDLRVLT